jgi:hypothetical protein
VSSSALGRAPRPSIKTGELVYGSLLLGSIGLTVAFGQPLLGAVVWYAQMLVTAAAVIAGMVIRERLRAPLRSEPASVAYAVAWRTARTTLTNDRLVSYVFTIVFLPLYLAAFSGWKAWITQSAPFSWDASLSHWDRVLHGGVDPWRVLHPWFGTPVVARALSTAYAYGWTIALHACVAWVAITRRPRLLVASMIAWPLCGLVLARWFLSAGPAFYAQVAPGPNPYRELVTFHWSIQSSAAFWQAYLWEVHAMRLPVLGAGISAMPSMHLTAGTLCLCAIWGQGRWWRVTGLTFLLVMLVGSIHTGWHYAVDSYVGIVCALVFWWITCRVVPDGSASSDEELGRSTARRYDARSGQLAESV